MDLSGDKLRREGVGGVIGPPLFWKGTPAAGPAVQFYPANYRPDVGTLPFCLGLSSNPFGLLFPPSPLLALSLAGRGVRRWPRARSQIVRWLSPRGPDRDTYVIGNLYN